MMIRRRFPPFLTLPRGLWAVLALALLTYSTVIPKTSAFAPHQSVAIVAPHHHHHSRVETTTTIISLDASSDKGFNLLETAGGLFLPQSALVKTAREGWKFLWRRMMAELAPQSRQTGSYERPKYSFNEFISSTNPKHPDVPNRYQVYLGNPCPWCHRVKLVLTLRNISKQEVSVVTLLDRPDQAKRGGWILKGPDPYFTDCRDLLDIYNKLSPNNSYSGRCTAPLLVDTKTKTIVSNESSDIVRMLEGCKFLNKVERMELYPENLRSEIDATNDWIYRDVNNGVYQCGFATTQEAYNEASKRVRAGLERCNDILSKQPFLCGSVFTEADLRLLPTMLRYDGAYSPLFHAGGAHLSLRGNYPYIYKWLKTCWNDIEGVPTTIELGDACGSYYKQLFPLNPSGIVPTPVSAQSLGLDEE